MGDPRPSHESGGEDVVLVGLRGFLDAVGRHEDGAREGGKFLFLVLPGRPVMAVEMGMLLQPRITVSGEHLSMGVDVDSLSGGLLQEFIQILEIVSGNEDGLPFLCPQGNDGGNGVSIGFRVGGVEEFHGPEVDLPAFQHEGNQVVDSQCGVARSGEGFVEKPRYCRIGFPEDAGMIGVGRDPLDAVDEEFLQGQHIGIGLRIGFDAHFIALGDQALQRRRRLEKH